MLRQVILLVLLATSSALECQDDRLGNCHCSSESLQASFELYCPSFRPNLQKIHIVVEPESFVKMTCSRGVTWLDILPNIQNLTVGNVRTFKVINCPVPADSFSSMLGMMGMANTTKLEYLTFKLKPRTQGGSELQGYHFANLSGLMSLELTQVGLKRVDKTFFENLQGLKSLDMTGNRDVIINPESLLGLKELQLFRCNQCDIKTLHVDTFRGLAKLRRISLHDNKLQELPAGIFDNLAALEDVSIKNNDLTSLPPAIFDKAQNLTKLDIGYNSLRSLPDKLFSKNPNFKMFSMAANGKCQPFRGCTPEKNDRLVLGAQLFLDSTVEEIKIIHSPIKELPPGLFRNCSKLGNLTIQFSMIEDIPSTLFQDTKMIEKIDFSANKVKTLANNLFQGLTELKYLRFIQNNLTRLEGGLLSDNKKLETFHFHENHIFDLKKEFFSKNKKIKEINLSKNSLTSWPGNPHPFEKLKDLDLSQNKMVQLTTDFFLNMLHLQKLNLSRNLFGQKSNGWISVHDIQFSDEKIVVDLSNNHIRTIDLSGLDTFSHQETSFNNNYNLNLTGNPLACDCWAIELKMKMEGKLSGIFENFFKLSNHNLRCDPLGNHPEVAGKLLQDVDYRHLNCPFPSSKHRLLQVNCTDDCRCSLNR